MYIQSLQANTKVLTTKVSVAGKCCQIDVILF
jgi:hypothetical protein